MRTPSFLPVPLTKVSATGNDFLIIDLLHDATDWNAGPATRHPRAQWVRAWCDRTEGIGADGAFFIEAAPGPDAFRWDFYNSDGSAAEMCGNAARAASLYFFEQSGKNKFSFKSRIGAVEAHVRAADDIEVSLAPIIEAEWNQWSENAVDKLKYDFVRAGVPHVVVQVPDLGDRDSLRALARELKRESRFVVQGTNVTFSHQVGDHALASVTFERGVEEFTKSCGTGAIAAAHAFIRGEENRAIEVQVPGGRLSVVWKQGRPHLRGPARILARVHWILGG